MTVDARLAELEQDKLNQSRPSSDRTFARSCSDGDGCRVTERIKDRFGSMRISLA